MSVLPDSDDLRHEYEMSMIIITHDMGVVAEAADDIIVMYAGQVVEQASTLDLDHPEHPTPRRCSGRSRSSRARTSARAG